MIVSCDMADKASSLTTLSSVKSMIESATEVKQSLFLGLVLDVAAKAIKQLWLELDWKPVPQSTSSKTSCN